MTGKSEISLDSMTVQELTALIGSAEGRRREKLDEAKAALWAEMEEKAAAIGLTLDAMRSASSGRASAERKTRKDAGTPVAAKFRGPNGEEWSGRGRPPTWLTVLEADGRNREQFRL